MPKGKKTCPKCDALSAASLKVCSCGHVFKKKLSKKKASPFFKERREFIKRMLGGAKSIDYRLDMMTVTKVFKTFNNDLDFLSKVKAPFKLEGSIKYFLTKDGIQYIKRKKLEFDYKPKNFEKMVDHQDKMGEDIKIEKRKTLRDFLDE